MDLKLQALIAHAPKCGKCGKRCYRKRQIARRVARMMEKEQGMPFDDYYCRDGGHAWHVGRPFKPAPNRRLKMTRDVAGIGIDPGKDGALALRSADDLLIYDFKNIEAARDDLMTLSQIYDIRFAILEKIWPRTGDNLVTINILIRNAAMWDTLLHLAGIDHDEYAPETWRKGLISRKKAGNKSNFVKKASAIFPRHKRLFFRPDRAEAALMAHRAFEHIRHGWATRKGA